MLPATVNSPVTVVLPPAVPIATFEVVRVVITLEYVRALVKYRLVPSATLAVVRSAIFAFSAMLPVTAAIALALVKYWLVNSTTLAVVKSAVFAFSAKLPLTAE